VELLSLIVTVSAAARQCAIAAVPVAALCSLIVAAFAEEMPQPTASVYVKELRCGIVTAPVAADCSWTVLAPAEEF